MKCWLRHSIILDAHIVWCGQDQGAPARLVLLGLLG
jgi:hypothetical protein